MIIQGTLSELDRIQREIDEYTRKLENRTEKFLNLLANKGISASKSALAFDDEFSNSITFEKKIEKDGSTITLVLSGVSEPQLREWYTSSSKEVVHEETISPILMAEFGSGQYANNSPNGSYGGRGTLNKYGHAFEDTWFWTDENGERQSSSGHEPSLPMLNAYLEMKNQIVSTAKEIYG